jgi:hypothetical protein
LERRYRAVGGESELVVLEYDRVRIKSKSVRGSQSLIYQRRNSRYLNVQLEWAAGAVTEDAAVEIQQVDLPRGGEKLLG